MTDQQKAEKLFKDVTILRQKLQDLAQTTRSHAVKIRILGKDIATVLRKVNRIVKRDSSISANDFDSLVEDINGVQRTAQNLRTKN